MFFDFWKCFGFAEVPWVFWKRFSFLGEFWVFGLLGLFSFLGSVFFCFLEVFWVFWKFPVFEKCFLFSGTVLVSWKWLRFSGSTLDFVGFGFSQSAFCFLEVFWFSRAAFSFV